MDQSGSEETLNHLTRLGQKQGVRSFLVLSQKDGAILRSSGFASTPAAPSAPTTATLGSDGTNDAYANGIKNQEQDAEEVARLVWNFVSCAKGTAEGLDGNDAEVKLLRLRTKKNEMVIVPDTNFLLVVIHDTPPA